MEATVHLLDLADAVGAVEPSPQALAATQDLLIAVPIQPRLSKCSQVGPRRPSPCPSFADFTAN